MRRWAGLLVFLPAAALAGVLTVQADRAAAQAEHDHMIQTCAALGQFFQGPEGTAALGEIGALLAGRGSLEGEEAAAAAPHLPGCGQVERLELDGESIGGSYLTQEGMLATFRWEDGALRFLSLYHEASDRYAAMDPAGGTVSVHLNFKGGGHSMSPWALALVQGALNKGGVPAVEQLPGIAVEHQSGGTVVISEMAPDH